MFRQRRPFVMSDEGLWKANRIISPIDIKWFYKINESGICINRKDLHMIVEDQNIPKDVKKTILKIFPNLEGRKN